MNKFIFLVSVLFFGTNSQAADRSHGSWGEACAEASQVVNEGDLIFTAIPNILFQKVAAATASWTSHVGIVFHDEQDGWVVYESAVPLARKVPLCRFLERSTKFQFEIKRLARPLTSIEVGRLGSAATDMLGSIYELGFNFDSRRMFCSKFTYLAYQTIGVEVGEIQTFQTLLDANESASRQFWNWWFLGSIPWSRRTVTPASQLNDLKFISVLKGR